MAKQMQTEYQSVADIILFERKVLESSGINRFTSIPSPASPLPTRFCNFFPSNSGARQTTPRQDVFEAVASAISSA
jgi:hypothetical protein